LFRDHILVLISQCILKLGIQFKQINLGDKKERVIFYFHPGMATFIQKDLDILKSKYRVYECSYHSKEKWKTPVLFIFQIIFFLKHIFKWANAISICQFAGYHSFIPTLWGYLINKPTVIVAGGTDCVSFPSLKYGNFQNRLLAFFSKASYKMVKVVSAVHKSLFLRKENYYINRESNQGILHFVPNASFIQNEIPNGFDIQTFSILTPWKDRIPNSFISISASLDNPVRMKLKGIDMVLELAKRLPDSIFTLVGAKNPGTLNIPPNVQLIPFVPNEELPQIYNTHKFYLQLSISEGFPNALCEAMACGCVPIVSEVASMPEIVGNNGLKIPSRHINILESLINSYVDQPELEAISTKASASISERYPIQLRKTEMLKLVDSL